MRTHLFFLGIIVSITFFGCTEDNFIVKDSELDNCSAYFEEYHSSINDKYLGLVAYNEITDIVGFSPVERFGPANNWYPLDPFKQVLCGNFSGYGFHDGSGQEKDWNLYVIPSPDFQSLIDDALVFKGGEGIWCFEDDWHTCNSPGYCMEAEITPHKGSFLVNNPWFPNDNSKDSPLEGIDICAYGPWVRECVHGNRPEIHPAELLWWRENWQESELFWMMAQLDDSDRYDTNDDYDFVIDGHDVDGWRPWSKAPLTAVFKIPFEVSTSTIGNRISFQVGDSFRKNVVTSEDPDIYLDADNGRTHVLEYNGKELVTVNEIQENDNDIGVTFVNLCKSNGMLRGFVQLKTKVGIESTNEKGHHIIFAAKTDNPGLLDEFKDLAVNSNYTMISTDPEPSNIIIGRDSLGINLYSTYKLQINRSDDKRTEALKVSKISQGGKSLHFNYDEKGETAIVEDLPVFRSGPLNIRLSDGTSKNISIDPLRIYPFLHIPKDIKKTKIPPTRALLKNWLKLNQAELFRTTDENLISEMGIVVSGLYGASEIEESSYLGDAINKQFQNTEDAKALLKNEELATVKWEIESRDLRNDTTIPSIETNGTSNQAAVLYSISNTYPMNNNAIKIYFNRLSAALVEIRITCHLVDIFGNKNERSFKVYNRELSVENTSDFYGSLDRILPIEYNFKNRDKEYIYKQTTPKTERVHFQLQSYIRSALSDGSLNPIELRILKETLDQLND